MKKGFIDKEIYEELMVLMKQNGINKNIFSLAKKMNINLPRLFYEKLVSSKDIKAKEQLSKNLLGIYGNYLATFYYQSLGYKVENEKPIYNNSMDSDGRPIGSADIYFIDEKGDKCYCEVKATKQILGNTQDYIDEETIKYRNIGKKLLKQVYKLGINGDKVIVIKFEGCYIDNAILEKLNDFNVSVKTLAIKIDDLEKMVDDIIDKVAEGLKNKKVFKKNKLK